MKSAPYRQPAPVHPINALRGNPPGHLPQPQYNPVGTLETSADELMVDQRNAYKQLKSEALQKMATEDYRPAVYAKALQYRNERTYCKKIDNEYVRT